MLRRDMLLAGAGTAAGLALARDAAAQKAQDTLRIVDRFALPNIDPYYNSLRTGLVQAHQAWDTLVHRDPDSFELKPLLATEWRWVDPKQLEFTLRRGVKFHDGSAFSADDVVYTLNLASSPESRVSVPSNFSWIANAEKIDDFKVRVNLKQPTPGRARILRPGHPDLPRGLSPAGRAGGLYQGPRRLRPLSHHQIRARRQRRV